MKRLFGVYLIVGYLCLMPSLGYANAFVSGPASEWTQILNQIQLLNSVIKQANMIKNQFESIQVQYEQLKSIKSYSEGTWGNASDALIRLHNLIREGQAISYSLGNFEEEFKKTYPGYVSPEDYVESYQSWTENTQDSIRSSLELAGFQNNEFQNEKATLNSIQQLSNNAVGQTQAIQAGTMLSYQLVEQLQKLRQLHMSQIQANNAYLAEEVNKENAINASMDEFIQPVVYQGKPIVY